MTFLLSDAVPTDTFPTWPVGAGTGYGSPARSLHRQELQVPHDTSSQHG